MQLMIYIHYSLLFFKNDNFKYRATFSKMITLNTEQHLKEDLLILSRYFTFFFISSFSFLFSLVELSYTKKHQIFNLYFISDILSFCHVMHYIVSEICIGRRLMEDSFYCQPQQIISDVANESLIPYNLVKRAPETYNLQHCNTECQPKPNKKV